MRALGLGAALVALTAGAGTAEEAAGAAAAVDSVIVTANRPTGVGKLDAPLREQPQNVSVIIRETLDDFGRPRLQDIAFATIGLQPVALQHGAQSYGFFLRGFNGAPIILDGYYSSNNQFGSVGILDLSTVESVEVLRGPAALLYGQGNPGGVVNLTSKLPLMTFGATAQAIVDDHGGRRFEADVTGPLGAAVSGRLVAVFEDSETFRDFIDHDRRIVSPRLQAQLGDLVELKLQYTYDDFRYTADTGPGSNPDLIRDLPTGRSVQEPGLRKTRTVNKWLRAEADVRLAEGWRARLGWFDHSNRYPRGQVEIDPGATAFGTTINRDLITMIDPDNNGLDDDMLTVQVLGDFATGPFRHRLTVAGDYIRNSSKYDYAYYTYSQIDYANPAYLQGPVTIPGSADLQFSGEGGFKSRVRAVYAQDLISIGDQWKLLVGVRREKIETRGFADPDRTIPTNQTRAEKTTPRLGVVYDHDGRLTLYGSYSEAFTPQYGLSFAGEPFDPEESRSYEIGVRRQFGSDLLLTAAVYDIRKKNILVVDPVQDGFNINAGVARSRGFEAELQGRVTEAWRIGAGLAYTNAKIVESVDPVTFPEGDRLPAAAKWSALLNTRYTVQDGALQGLTLGGNLAYTGRRPYRLPNIAPTLPAYTRVDVFARYPVTEAVEMQLNVNNLTNERILLANGYGRVQFDQSRTVVLTLRWAMGAFAE